MGLEEEWSTQVTGGQGQSQAQEQREPAMGKVAGPFLHGSPTVAFTSAGVWLVSRAENMANTRFLVLHLNLYFQLH